MYAMKFYLLVYVASNSYSYVHESWTILHSVSYVLLLHQFQNVYQNLSQSWRFQYGMYQ